MPAIMTTGLEAWLKQATRHLSKNSAAQVRSEIQEHYESARAAAISGGATTNEAELSALAALGDAKVANCQYRNVLLTSAEARLLGEGNWEAFAVCTRMWPKAVFLLMSVAAVFAANELLLKHAGSIAWALFAGGAGLGLLFAAPFLPVYTPKRARVFRTVRWAVMLAILILAFWPNPLQWSWLLFACLWPMARVEWMRISIRRKLPVGQWPKQLYL